MAVAGIYTPFDIVMSHRFRDRPYSEVYGANTLMLARDMMSKKPLGAKKLQFWKDKLAADKIDCDAFIECRIRGNAEDRDPDKHPPGASPEHEPEAVKATACRRFWLLLMLEGRQGAQDLFPLILDRFSGLNKMEKGIHIANHFLMEVTNRPFLEAYLRHPAVDINAQIFDHGHTLLDEAIMVIHDASHGTADGLAHWSAPDATAYAHILLERGAVLNPRIADHYIKEEEPSVIRDLLTPYLRQWQDRWQEFSRGNLAADQITAEDLGHFYSLGHMNEALHRNVWAGHELKALELFELLPEWVKNEHPCEIERTVLAVCSAPGNLIASSDIHHDGPALPPPKSTKAHK